MFELWANKNWMKVHRDERGRFSGSRNQVDESDVRREVREYFSDQGYEIAVLVNRRDRVTRMPIYTGVNNARAIFSEMMARRKNKNAPGTIEIIAEDYGWTYQYEGRHIVYVSRFGAYFVKGNVYSLQAWIVADILYKYRVKNTGYNLFYTTP